MNYNVIFSITWKLLVPTLAIKYPQLLDPFSLKLSFHCFIFISTFPQKKFFLQLCLILLFLTDCAKVKECMFEFSVLFGWMRMCIWVFKLGWRYLYLCFRCFCSCFYCHYVCSCFFVFSVCMFVCIIVLLVIRTQKWL